MNTIVIKDTGDIQIAADIIRNGGLAAFPTETVYGLGGNALDPEASKKIYAAKGRPSDNPLIVHIADMDGLFQVARDIPETAQRLAERFWPGPLTMVLNKTDIVPVETTGGLDTVAVRMPSFPQARQLIKLAKVPVAAPSANTSGRPSPTTAQHVIDDLGGKIEAVIDGGPVAIGLESTIVDLTQEVPTLLRPGGITLEELRDCLGWVDVDPAILGIMADGVKPKAPGMKYRHYAPKAEMTIVTGDAVKVQFKINYLAARDDVVGKKVGIIATDETVGAYYNGVIKSIGSRKNEETVAHNLFALLREFDDIGVEVIYAEGFEDSGIGRAIMNRMRKAAGNRVIEV